MSLKVTGAAMLAAGTIGMGAASAVSAQTTGFYAYAGVGQTSKSASHADANRITATGGAGQTTSFDESDGSWRVGAGYRFNRNWGLELAYARYGDITHTAANIGLNTTVTKAEPKAWQVTAMGFLPTSGKVEFFGRAGLAFTRTSVSAAHAGLGQTIASPAQGESDTVPVIGAGLNWNPSGGLLVRVEVEHVFKYAYGKVEDLRPVFGAFAQPGGELKTDSTTLAVSVGYRF